MKVKNGIAHFFWMHTSCGMMETMVSGEAADKIAKMLGKKSKNWKLDDEGVKLPKKLNKKWSYTDDKTGITTSGGDDEEYEELDTPLHVLLAEPEPILEEATLDTLSSV